MRETSERLTLERQNYDIVTLMQNAVGQMPTTTNEHTIAIDGLSVLTLWVDPVRLEQIMVNLLENAIKYCPDGGSIEVSVSTPEPQTAQLIVQDYGIGIASERREQLFNRFYQADGEGHFGGMGVAYTSVARSLSFIAVRFTLNSLTTAVCAS